MGSMLKSILVPVTLVFTAIFMQQAYGGSVALEARHWRDSFHRDTCAHRVGVRAHKRHHLAHRLRPRLLWRSRNAHRMAARLGCIQMRSKKPWLRWIVRYSDHPEC